MRLVLLGALPWASVGFARRPRACRARRRRRARARARRFAAHGARRAARKAKERQIAVLKEEVASAGAAHPLGERMALVASGGFDADAVDGVDSLLDALERAPGGLARRCASTAARSRSRARARTRSLSRVGDVEPGPLGRERRARARARALPLEVVAGGGGYIIEVPPPQIASATLRDAGAAA